MISLKEFTSTALQFAKDTKEWGELDPYKHYTTNGTNTWIKSCDNEHGGMDLEWAFHLSKEEILKLVEEEYMNQKEELVESLLERDLCENLTEDQEKYIKKEMLDMDIKEDESISLKDTKMIGGSNQEEIFEVVLTNGDVERHVCFI